MKRPRPYIPLAVRVQVAKRQLMQRDRVDSLIISRDGATSQKLGDLLFALFAMQPVDLDHNPPLRARPYNPRIKDSAARYTPNANDPRHLQYRLKAPEAELSHYIKTHVRGDHGQFSDRVLIKREKRRERRTSKKAAKVRRPKRNRTGVARLKRDVGNGRKIKASGQPSAWPTGRKIASRPFAR